MCLQTIFDYFSVCVSTDNMRSALVCFGFDLMTPDGTNTYLLYSHQWERMSHDRHCRRTNRAQCPFGGPDVWLIGQTHGTDDLKQSSLRG